MDSLGTSHAQDPVFGGSVRLACDPVETRGYAPELRYAKPRGAWPPW